MADAGRWLLVSIRAVQAALFPGASWIPKRVTVIRYAGLEVSYCAHWMPSPTFRKIRSWHALDCFPVGSTPSSARHPVFFDQKLPVEQTLARVVCFAAPRLLVSPGT